MAIKEQHMSPDMSAHGGMGATAAYLGNKEVGDDAIAAQERTASCHDYSTFSFVPGHEGRCTFMSHLASFVQFAETPRHEKHGLCTAQHAR